MKQPATPRDAWPMYVVLHDLHPRLPVRVENILLISTSFSFAREVCLQYKRIGRHRFNLEILRVTHVTRSTPVAWQSSMFVRTLDRDWSRPPPLMSTAYCQLCMEVCLTDQGPVRWIHGVHPNLDGTLCQQQSQLGSLVGSHQPVLLNTILETWPPQPLAKDALQSAKLAWIGLLYFAKAMRQRVPVPILDSIVEAAMSHQQICQGSEDIQKH
ncbi:hypothetical protein ABBQ38_005210 [Trebouxia sp. C0009 RCD-2024]